MRQKCAWAIFRSCGPILSYYPNWYGVNLDRSRWWCTILIDEASRGARNNHSESFWCCHWRESRVRLLPAFIICRPWSQNHLLYHKQHTNKSVSSSLNTINWAAPGHQNCTRGSRSSCKQRRETVLLRLKCQKWGCSALKWALLAHKNAANDNLGLLTAAMRHISWLYFWPPNISWGINPASCFCRNEKWRVFPVLLSRFTECCNCVATAFFKLNKGIWQICSSGFFMVWKKCITLNKYNNVS